MGCRGVGVRVHGDVLDVEAAAGAGDTAGDLAAIRYQETFEHFLVTS
jgi:hypothetical protein